MGDTDHDSGTMSSPTPIKPDHVDIKTGGDAVVKKQSTSSEYEQSLQIVLGTVCGVFGLLGLLLILSLLYRLYKKRQARRRASDNRDHELNSSISIDLEHKQTPTVLVLYSYDCAAHEKVVSSFAGYLIETCNCNVHVDLFEDQIITERGLDEWLVDRLQEADFILVLCSIGARLRCTKKRVRFKLDPYRRIPDYFAVAVDYVAEKMRVERSKGLPMSRFINVYFDYSTASDIPHQLEMGSKFCMMKDISKLFCHIHGYMSDRSKCVSTYPALSDNYFESSELGLELKVAIDSAKEYFRCNPNWVEDSMELLPPPSKSKSHLIRKSSLEPLLPQDEAPKDVIERTREYLDTTVDIHRQSLPPYPDNLKQSSPTLQSRQNSLPSSLSSKGLSTPSPPAHTSKSFDNFKGTNRYSADIETLKCMVCGLKEHQHERGLCSKGLKPHQNHIHTTEEDDLTSTRLKSKSMPTVCTPRLRSSQTVLRADVHKEWEEHENCFPSCQRQGSFSDSQESSSCKDVTLDDLEKDVQSIIMSKHQTNLEKQANFEMYEGTTSQYLRNISLPVSGAGDLSHKLSAIPTVKAQKVYSSSSSSIGSMEERMCQFHDIRL